MRTTLDIDIQALSEAMKVSPGKTKTEVVNEALRAYARRERVSGLLEYEGKIQWEGNLDHLRRRVPKKRR